MGHLSWVGCYSSLSWVKIPSCSFPVPLPQHFEPIVLLGFNGLITCSNRPLWLQAKTLILDKLNQKSLLAEHQDVTVPRRGQER